MSHNLNLNSSPAQIAEALQDMENDDKAFFLNELRKKICPENVNFEFMAAVVAWNEIGEAATGLGKLRAAFAIGVMGEMEGLSAETTNAMQLCLEEARESIAKAELHVHLAIQRICAFAQTLPLAFESAPDQLQKMAIVDVLDVLGDAMKNSPSGASRSVQAADAKEILH